ncbi:hypothetical protein O1611_g6587 [Lasiodiplodia mahajangana]|uniref:Uncharacterized protein n=1 Tax=Lasiodiplodia mahajangana TaxID=1108764 RepID=A0ACC2JHW2_9PEZI|nr:hypothetical protein O1611_g6587 [Lasiodiplodia mahajangana]
MPKSNASDQFLDLAPIRNLITNYRIMIDHVNRLDEHRNTQITSDFSLTMAEVQLPFAKKYIESVLETDDLDHFLSKGLQVLILEIERLLAEVEPQGKEYVGKADEGPFLLLLRLAVRQGAIRFDKPKDDDKEWGEMSSFQGYLNTLGRELKDVVLDNGNRYWPGLPSCVLAHVNTDPDALRWDPVISASADRYNHFSDQGQWRGRRHDQMSRLEQKCPQDVVRRIQNLKSVAVGFNEWVSQNKRDKSWVIKNYRSPSTSKDALTGIPVNLPGMLATWFPNGDYKTSCLLDRFRFFVTKPPNAKRRERAEKDHLRDTYPYDACAEWSGFLEWCALTQAWPTTYKPTRWPPPEDSTEKRSVQGRYNHYADIGIKLRPK